MKHDIQKPLTPGDDWNPAPPETVPGPSIWPATLGLGSTFLIWGLISHLLLTITGLAICAWAIVGWIGELRHERNPS